MGPLEIDPDAWSRELAALFGSSYPRVRDPLVDRLEFERLEVDTSLWRFRVRWTESGGPGLADLTLRILPPGGGARCRKEARALQLCGRLRLPVPDLWLESPEHEPPFLAFDRVEGEQFGVAWSRRRPEATPDMVGGLLAQLHAGTERSDLRTSAWSTRDATGEVRRRAAEASDRETAGALEYLWSIRPDPVPAALCHGAFRPEHVLLDAEGNPTLIGWSHSDVGDPRLDLARASVAAAMDYGGALRTPFLKAYRRERPVDPESLGWFEALAGLERALGASPDERQRLSEWLSTRIGRKLDSGE